ncbi:hypothetical protein [Photobacterium kasasachensis]|uniref:hypothetical protein n=1 Tax=Photobacterium kasasachensis TaxID=2910240 RepID=UPI003D108D91
MQVVSLFVTFRPAMKHLTINRYIVVKGMPVSEVFSLEMQPKEVSHQAVMQIYLV